MRRIIITIIFPLIDNFFSSPISKNEKLSGVNSIKYIYFIDKTSG